jgi:hypothetical protein
MRYWPTKTAVEVRDAGLDWGPTLSKLGDPTIVASSWSKLHGTASVNLVGAHDDRTTSTRVSGGTAGQETVFRNTVTLSNGNILTEDVFQRVRA